MKLSNAVIIFKNRGYNYCDSNINEEKTIFVINNFSTDRWGLKK